MPDTKSTKDYMVFLKAREDSFKIHRDAKLLFNTITEKGCDKLTNNEIQLAEAVAKYLQETEKKPKRD